MGEVNTVWFAMISHVGSKQQDGFTPNLVTNTKYKERARNVSSMKKDTDSGG